MRPRSWVVGILVTILVGGVETVQRRLTRAVSSVFGAFETALTDAGTALESAFASAGNAVLEVQALVNIAIMNAAASSGLAAPLTSAILFAVGVAAAFAILGAILNAVKWIT